MPVKSRFLWPMIEGRKYNRDVYKRQDEMLGVINQVLVEANRELRVSVSLDANDISQLARNLLGLTQDEAARTLRKCLLAHGKADAELLSAVLDAKNAILRSDGLLETVRRDSSFTDVAGLKRLREWVDKRRSALTTEGDVYKRQTP